MSIPQKGWILVAIPLLAQLLFLGVLSLSRMHQQYTQERALHTNVVLAEAETCHRHVIEAQTHMRGYVLTGAERFVGLYEKTRKRIPGDFRQLEVLVEDNPEQQRAVREMSALASAFLDWMSETIRMTQGGQRQEVVQRIQAADGLNYVDTLRERMEAFLMEEGRLNAERLVSLERAATIQSYLLMGGVILAVVTSLALLVAFSHSVSDRVATLIGNTRRLAEGKELAAPLTGKDELWQIDAMFHEMAKVMRQKEQENELFVYSVSHDLRSPLVNLQGFSQELSMVVTDLRALMQSSALPEQVKATANKLIDRDAAEAIRFIQSAVTRLAGIIDALLRLSRIGRVEFRMQDVDVEAVVRRVVLALNNSLVQRKAEIHVNQLPPCWGDTRAVDQIFANLIGNAVNYLDPARPGKIEVGCLGEGQTPGSHVYFVKDNGVGIPESLQVKVFVAFQRLHPEAAPGEGIGLALVRRVVERLAGKVWLESVPGEGSTFYVALPVSHEARSSSVIVPKPAPPLAPPPPAATTPGSSSEWQAITPASQAQP